MLYGDHILKKYSLREKYDNVYLGDILNLM
jgi:hypothetical protein